MSSHSVLSPPTSEQVRAARLQAGLTQEAAAQLISAATLRAWRTWQSYEAAEDQPGHRKIPRASWELFLLLTDQHPSLRLIRRSA